MKKTANTDQTSSLQIAFRSGCTQFTHKHLSLKRLEKIFSPYIIYLNIFFIGYLTFNMPQYLNSVYMVIIDILKAFNKLHFCCLFVISSFRYFVLSFCRLFVISSFRKASFRLFAAKRRKNDMRNDDKTK